MKRGIDAIGVGAGAATVDEQGRLFLARRGPEAKNERGLWESPGGSVEFGETPANAPKVRALQREMREEYRVEIAVGELLDVVDHGKKTTGPFSSARPCRKRWGLAILPDEGQHWVSPTYVCTTLSGRQTIRETAKCAGIGWFAPSEVPEELTRVTRVNLAHYKERYLYR